MEVIFTVENPCNIIRSIQIYKPLRGYGGTLSYHVNIDGYNAIFEINDEANWEITHPAGPLQISLLGYINQLILNLEKDRVAAIL